MSRTILITGGTGGLGQTVVQAFLKQGDQVSVCDLHNDFSAFIAALGNPANLTTFQVSVTDPSDLQQLSEKVSHQFQGLDVLINLVGGFHWAHFAETSVNDLDKMLNLNIRSCFLTTQSLLPLLLKSPTGRIINVGARAGFHGGAGVTAYALAKAGVINLTQSLAQELIDSNLTVNAVVPSVIDTPANRASMPDADPSKWVTPADLAHVIRFLAAPESQAVSGAVLPVYHKA